MDRKYGSILSGICAGAVNGLLGAGGGMVLAYIISVTLFKEKFTTMQKLGILLGVCSLLFLNIPFGELGHL